MRAINAKKYLWLLLMPTLLLVLSAAPRQEYTPPHDRPGPATDTINFSAYDVDIASREMEAGSMDMYLFSLKTPAAEKLAASQDITVFQAPSATISVVLNPADAPEGQLNPLSIKEVRQALQLVVNRPFVAQEIYKGFALPMLTHVSPADFDSLTVFNLLKESQIRYDPQLADEMVTTAMTKAGATKQDGYWYYNGEQLKLKFIIRTEDERWEIGNTLRVALDQLGFTIVPIPQQFGPAIFTVYGTDPQLFQWHLYTEGWGRGAPERYDFASINQMCAPWLGSMPGWQEVGFWQYESARLDDLGQRIFTGDFRDQAERDELYVEATQACLDESVRLWVVTVVTNTPADSNLVGITQDVVAGPKSLWTLREAYLPGSPEQLNVGNLWVWTNRTTWNPVGGFGDVYSSDIWNNLHDSPTWTHPFTGLPIPFRADYEVETAGPTGKLDLPADAFLWNADAGRWSTVPAGTRAISKVTFDYSKYLQSTWHHGQPITMADVLYPIAQLFDMVYNEDKASIEFSIANTSRPFTDTFRGFRLVGDDKLEVYVDYWHFVDDYIGQFSSVSGVSMPWEVLAAMDDLVFAQNKAAYSDTSAARFNVPWISLVMDNDARLVRNTLRDFAASDFQPAGALTVDGDTLVSAEEAAQRYQAAIDWFAEKKHMVVSNGPFFLDTFDSAAQFARIKAFREAGYPFRPGDLYYGAPPTIEITDVSGATLQAGAALDTEIALEGPGELAVRYVLQDPASTLIITSGQAESISPGRFRVQVPAGELADLTGDLYYLYLAAYSDQLSSMVERRIDIEFGAAPVQPTPTTQATATGPQPTSPAQPTATAAPTASVPADGDGGNSVGAIIGIVLAAAAVVGVGLLVVVTRPGRKAA